MAPFITVDQDTGEIISCPCGHCPPCLKRRASGWAFRLQQEEKQSDSALFVTLTYDTKYIPITKQGTFTLDKIHVQQFFKRLRWNQSKRDTLRHTLPIKYFAVGEYGSQTYRPHYHTIIFNCNHSEVISSWKDVDQNQPLGEIHFGTVTPASIAYTLKYMLKSGHKFKKSDLRKPEFQLMSKGLGKSYLNAKTQLWHTQKMEERMFLTTEDNKKVAMPRYFKERLYTKEEKQIINSNMVSLRQKTEKFNFEKQETASQKKDRSINLHRLMNKKHDTDKL